MASLNSPFDKDLCASFVVFSSNLFDCFMLKYIWLFNNIFKCIDTFCNRAVTDWVNVVFFQESYKIILNVIWMKFNFRAHRLDSAVGENIPSKLDVEIGKSNRFNKTLVN